MIVGKVKFVLALCTVTILSTLHQYLDVSKVELLGGYTMRTTHANITVVFPYSASNRSSVMDSIRRWVEIGSPCQKDEKYDAIPSAQLIFYVNTAVGEDDVMLAQWAIKTLGGHSACFSRVMLLGAQLNQEDDVYPGGPSNMFFKVFLEPRLHNEFRTSTHMFWMEHDVYPLRPGWLDILQKEAAKGEFWISGSMYLGNGLNAAVEVADNWNWIGHINGNALYDLRDPAFIEFLRVVTQYEPPSHFWKPFDISIWRVIHAFPYTWPIYQRYRSKFVYSDYINHWGFHISNIDMRQSASRPNAYFVHGNQYSAGNQMLRPKPTYPGIVWDDKVQRWARVSIAIRCTRALLAFCDEAAQSALRFVPGAIELVFIVPPPDAQAFHQHFNSTTTSSSAAAAARIVVSHPPPSPAPALAAHEQDALHHAWAGLHADIYCEGDLILDLDADAVFNRDLLLRDILWAGRPLLPYARPPAADQRLLWAAATAYALRSPPQPYDFAPAGQLRVLPRGVYAAARRLVESAHAAGLADVIRAAAAAPLAAGGHFGFSAEDMLGAYAWRYAQESVALAPADAEEREAMALPPPVVPAAACRGNARRARSAEEAAALVRSMREAWAKGMPCHTILQLP